MAVGGVTFEDIAVYFSWKEWRLLDEAQRRLYHHVMLENFTLISSLGCCCGAKAAEAPIEQSASGGMSQTRTPRATLSSWMTHPCEMCGAVLRDIFHLAEHQGKERSQKLLRCRACGKQFYFSIKFQQQEHHVKQKPFINMDTVSFVKSWGIHDSGKSFACVEVQKDFLSGLGHLQQEATEWGEVKHNYTSTLIKYQRIHTGERPYEYNECGKSFTTNLALCYHHRVHTGERPYKCSECGKSFVRKNSLSVCLKVHSGEKPYKCNECGKSWRCKSTFIQHQRIHTGERPYECSECGKSFTSRSALHSHQRVHTGEWHYECTDCGKSFTTTSDLHSHKRVHNSERPYLCTECGKSFIQRNTLNVHVKVYASESLYKCNEYGTSLNYNIDFRSAKQLKLGFGNMGMYVNTGTDRAIHLCAKAILKGYHTGMPGWLSG
ncbi:unnamed protein product [Nyctereutes procyonoides]|uniref:(raccoon dog) hypothetical protein n=1 Tax=Nyctereutes procyonoides TaxID=34880 RepID=A0A811ZTT1_NYCPR|nr:unnamed protein product [Nyctereutes procyonoides]